MAKGLGDQPKAMLTHRCVWLGRPMMQPTGFAVAPSCQCGVMASKMSLRATFTSPGYFELLLFLRRTAGFSKSKVCMLSCWFRSV